MSDDVGILIGLEALRALAPGGFAIALHVRFQTPTYLFQTYPREWIEDYSREGMVMRDPTVGWAFANTGRIAWADIEGAADSDVLVRAAEHGLRHGVVVAVARGGSRSMASFVRSDRPFSDAEGDAIEAAMIDLHDATASARPLAAATREALRRISVAFTHPYGA